MVTPNGELINQKLKKNDRNEIIENEIDIRLTDNSNYRSTLQVPYSQSIYLKFSKSFLTFMSNYYITNYYKIFYRILKNVLK